MFDKVLMKHYVGVASDARFKLSSIPKGFLIYMSPAHSKMSVVNVKMRKGELKMKKLSVERV